MGHEGIEGGERMCHLGGGGGVIAVDGAEEGGGGGKLLVGSSMLSVWEILLR